MTTGCYLAMTEAMNKIVSDAMAESGLTTEDFKNPDPSPKLARRIKIFWQNTGPKFEAVIERAELTPEESGE